MNFYARVAFVVGFLVVDLSGFDFYANHAYIIVLFIIVFSGQIWMTARSVIQKNRTKWFCLCFLSINLFSLFVSKINFINTAAINSKIIQRNVFYKHQINVVSSEIYKKGQYKYLEIDIIVPKKDTLFFSGRKIHQKELERYVLSEKNNWSNHEFDFLNFILFFDRNTYMQTVYNLKKRLKNLGINKVSYAVKAPTEVKPFYYKSNYFFAFNLSSNLMAERDIDKFVTLQLINNEKSIFNDTIILNKDIGDKVKRLFMREGFQSIKFSFKENTPFQDYFHVFSSSKMAIDELRKEYAKTKYAAEYNSLSRDAKKEINRKYFWHVFEVLEK